METWKEMATNVISSSVKRAWQPAGFYCTLHNRSSEDVLDVGLGAGLSNCIRKLRVSANCDLPEGCYEKELHVAKR